MRATFRNHRSPIIGERGHRRAWASANPCPELQQTANELLPSDPFPVPCSLFPVPGSQASIPSNSAEPMRTMVAPSAIANSKSPLIPIDNSAASTYPLRCQ